MKLLNGRKVYVSIVILINLHRFSSLERRLVDQTPMLHKSVHTHKTEAHESVHTHKTEGGIWHVREDTCKNLVISSPDVSLFIEKTVCKELLRSELKFHVIDADKP